MALSCSVVDPGIGGADLDQLADDLDRLGPPVVAGFSTHPHWDSAASAPDGFGLGDDTGGGPPAPAPIHYSSAS